MFGAGHADRAAWVKIMQGDWTSTIGVMEETFEVAVCLCETGDLCIPGYTGPAEHFLLPIRSELPRSSFSGRNSP
jgi:hypothetical protein